MAYKTNLVGNDSSFATMMANGFGIVTVMNAMVFDAPDVSILKSKTAYQILEDYPEGGTGYRCTLDTLKIANVTQEGPTKTITGGQYSNPLVKFGKSARLEIQDALGKAEAIEALCGGIQEWKEDISPSNLVGLHFGEDFAGPKMIIGDSFFIDRKSGQQVKVKIIFYQFLPDSLFNLTQDAEGDATVFDMNGDLLTTDILVADTEKSTTNTHGVFYSIVDPSHAKAVSRTITNTASAIAVSVTTGESVYYSTNGGLTWDDSAPTTWTEGDTILAKVEKDGVIVYSTTIVAAANKA